MMNKEMKKLAKKQWVMIVKLEDAMLEMYEAHAELMMAESKNGWVYVDEVEKTFREKYAEAYKVHDLMCKRLGMKRVDKERFGLYNEKRVWERV